MQRLQSHEKRFTLTIFGMSAAVNPIIEIKSIEKHFKMSFQWIPCKQAG
jgi:hypothetical protein